LSAIDSRSVSSSRMAQLINAIRLVNSRLEETNRRMIVWNGPRLTFVRLTTAPEYTAPVSSGVTPVESQDVSQITEEEDPVPADYVYEVDYVDRPQTAPRAAPIGGDDVGTMDTFDQVSPETRELQERIQGRIREQADRPAPQGNCRW
jgi:hypothetical protein